jgi:hypothetical protein
MILPRTSPTSLDVVASLTLSASSFTCGRHIVAYGYPAGNATSSMRCNAAVGPRKHRSRRCGAPWTRNITRAHCRTGTARRSIPRTSIIALAIHRWHKRTERQRTTIQSISISYANNSSPERHARSAEAGSPVVGLMLSPAGAPILAPDGTGNAPQQRPSVPTHRWSGPGLPSKPALQADLPPDSIQGEDTEQER